MRNSNQSLVLGAIGIIPGRKRSTSMFENSRENCLTNLYPSDNVPGNYYPKEKLLSIAQYLRSLEIIDIFKFSILLTI